MPLLRSKEIKKKQADGNLAKIKNKANKNTQKLPQILICLRKGA